jgi:hypothetical protein
VPCGFGLVLACRSLADGDGRDALPKQALHTAARQRTWNTFTLASLAFLYVCTQPWTQDGTAQLAQVANSLDEPVPPPVVGVLLVV